jgi:hypothetical protein
VIRRSIVRACGVLLAAFLLGCPSEPVEPTPEPTPSPGPGRLDTSALGDARELEPYTGRVTVAEYDGPARFESRNLPAGLELSAEGLFSGVPTRFDLYEVTVVASELEGVRDFAGRVVLRVRPALADGPFLGFGRSYLNNSWNDHGYLRDPWLRVEANEPFVLDVGLYEGGDDGEATAGLRDDVRIATIPLAEISVEVGEYVPTADVEPSLPSYPSGHFAEGSPPVWDAESGTFMAGADTGHLDVVVTHAEYGTVGFRLAVLPPTFCVDGDAFGCE